MKLTPHQIDLIIKCLDMAVDADSGRTPPMFSQENLEEIGQLYFSLGHEKHRLIYLLNPTPTWDA